MSATDGAGAGTGRAVPGAAVARPSRAAPDRELVLKRNNVERLKAEKFPLEIFDEIPALGAQNYLDLSEEDMVRFQWYGLYHDKPKVGYFMMRVKVPGGRLTAPQYRVLGELAQQFGRDYTELSTRQTVQIHWIRIAQLPEVFGAMDAVGLTSLGGCGDTVRNTTGCPVAGLDADELFDARPQLDEVVKYFQHERDYYDLPRKHKISISACADQCNAPEINCIAFTGTSQPGPDGQPQIGYSVRVGGGLSSTPRIARELESFVTPDEVLPTARAILDVWRADLRYRMSRAKARLKFLVDDYGVDGVKSAVEEKLGHPLTPLAEIPQPRGHTDHLGVHPQKQEGLFYVGFPVFLGQVSGDQSVQIANLVESFGGDIRITRQQNFILTGVPAARLDEVIARVAEIGFSLDVNRLRGASVACTGQPLCNYAVAETKTRLQEIVVRLEERFGRQVEGLKLGVDGCPHACAHHWVTDIGLQGTTGRGSTESGKLEAYEIYLRGGLGANAAIGRPIIRRVPADQAAAHVERLVEAYLAERQPDEGFQAYAQRKSDEELIQIATGEPQAAAVS